MMKRVLVLLFAVLSLMLAPGSGARAAEVKVVYHMADGIEQASRGLASIRNHLRAEPDTKIVVVALGEGIRALARQGVEFRVCNNTLTAHNVAPSELVPEITLVPAGVAEIARLQAREGYAYIRP
jgi:intracellular sulfur oxidation DsrE/DsrF family protein